MTGSSGREEPQFFLDQCETVAVTGDTMNCVSYSIARANPVASANTGEGMVSPSVLVLSTQWTDGVSSQVAMRDGAEARGEGKLGMDVTRIEIENKVGFPVNLNLIAGHALAEGAGLDHRGYRFLGG